MRILTVTHAYPRFEGDVAGAFLERLALALVARGHEVRVVAPSDEGRGGHDERNGVAVERVRYASARRETLAYRGTMVEASRSLGGARSALGLVAALRRGVMRSEEWADVVHAHWWLPAGLAAWRARRRGGPPYVVTVHGTDARLARRPLVRTVATRVFRNAAGVTAVSRFLAEDLPGCERHRPLIAAMPVGVPPAARPSQGGGGVVTVGRLSPQKRIDQLLEAMALLHREGRGRPLTIVGDGAERAALERRAGALGIAADTRFTGALPPARVPDVIGDADVFAFPARGEGFGLAAAEALMLGIPVVAMTDGGGVLDIVVPPAGRVAPPDDPVAFANAIADLATEPNARAAARDAGADLARRLAPDAVAERFEAYFREVVA